MPQRLTNQLRALPHAAPYSPKSRTISAITLLTLGLCGCPLIDDDGSDAARRGARDPSAQVAPLPRTLLPTRIRRLTNAELSESVKRLLGSDDAATEGFTPDTRQDGFTRNDAQRVDPVFIAQLTDAAQRASQSAKPRVQELAPCSAGAGDAQAAEQCARGFLQRFVRRAYRRPPAQHEIDGLLMVYRAGASGGGYADGIVATLQAVLQSPAFVYLTELGDAEAGSVVTLTPYEVASLISYLLIGGPPDDALLEAAEREQLARPAERRAQAERLLAQPGARRQVTRMVAEWLGIDRIGETAKDARVYPEFAGLRGAMQHEADAFIAETMWKPDGGGLTELLSARWTIAEDALARMYLDGAAPRRSGDRVQLGGVRRRGILSQGAFLAVNAHAHESAPVLRGVSVLRRVLCQDIPSPTTLDIDVVPPIPDPALTTRERFAIHSKDPVCAQCHDRIDAIGFSFEHLDGMGKARTVENGRPIDSKSKVILGGDFDGDHADSAALLEGLAASTDVRTCFARHLFRFASARSGEAVREVEDAFVQSTSAVPASAPPGELRALLLALIASDAFILRGAET